MKLAISSIAWTNNEDQKVAELLRKLGVRYVELAPTKKWDDPTHAPRKEVQTYKAFWESYGIEVVAFQSMLFNRPDLKLFESKENLQATTEYLKEFIKLAADFGAGSMVFGSPKNRQKDGLSYKEARTIATPFFNQLGTVAQEYNTIFCIEPNAPQYGCDFITSAEEGIEIVELVNNPGFGLHLDMACMTLAGDNVKESIIKAKPYLEHFHISSPMLEQVEDRSDVNHAEAAEALRSIGYNNFVSIEMRPAKSGQNLARIEHAVQFAQNIYSS